MMVQVWNILLVTALLGFCVAFALVYWVRSSPAPQRNELSRCRASTSPGSLTQPVR